MGIKIMIADDHLFFRRAVRELIEREPDLEVVAEARDGQEAVQFATEAQPDVVLMNLVMSACDSFQATKRILIVSPCSRVVILSASGEEEQMLKALQSGAIGYITKEIDEQGLLTAIRRAAQDDLYITAPLAARLVAFLRTLKPARTRQAARPQPTPGSETDSQAAHAKKKRGKHHLPLTEREREVLNLIRRGQRNREIARELSIAESTVHKHIQHIFEKLNARNRAEALFLTQG
ncbi:MAG TPA: response regulator transcription factor [Ktedonobacteraceae bacterium]|nr:response regulator transcription factor [Ktedonobacteraceae bacterium]